SEKSVKSNSGSSEKSVKSKSASSENSVKSVSALNDDDFLPSDQFDDSNDEMPKVPSSKLRRRCAVCPKDSVSDGRGRCFRFNQAALSNQNAQESCMRDGGVLADIRDGPTLEFVRKIPGSPEGDFWLGTSSDPLAITGYYTNWLKGDPPSSGNPEAKLDCGAVVPSSLFKWEARRCSEEQAFICERNPMLVTTTITTTNSATTTATTTTTTISTTTSFNTESRPRSTLPINDDVDNRSPSTVFSSTELPSTTVATTTLLTETQSESRTTATETETQTKSPPRPPPSMNDDVDN
ncbi:unnamed protein product, partial [Owenia fusiformis]